MARPIIAEQAREEIQKVSDLIEIAGSRPDLARWKVGGILYEYFKGAARVTARPVRSGNSYQLDLEAPNKTAAKRAVLADLHT